MRSGRSLAPLLLLAGVLALPCSAALADEPAKDATEADAIVLGERRPISFLLVTPTGKVGSTTSSEIIRIVSDMFSAHTDLAPVQVDPAVVADCKGRLGCYARKIRNEHVRGARPKLLLVLSNLTQDRAADRLSVILLDLERAEEIDGEVSRSADDWESEVEGRLAESAILARPRWSAVESEDAARNYLQNVFGNDLRRALESTGDWEPYGEIELAVERAGLGVDLDGVTTGLTRAPKTRIVRVLPGRHTLRVSDPKIEPWSTELVVERGQRATATVVVNDARRSVLGRGLFWTGAGTVVVGATLTLVALARHDGTVESLCVARPGAACAEGSAFQTTGYAPDRAPTYQDVNPPGLLLAPLGYSLAGAGATWLVSSLLFDDPDRFPWIELAVGLALGATAYGVSAALDGPSAFAH